MQIANSAIENCTTSFSGGVSVRIFIPSGNPEELKIIEVLNWIGKGFVFPRALYAQVRQNHELVRSGVYVLWGPDESTQRLRVYIGEGDPVRARIDSHVREQDFWTHAVVFVSKDQNLNKAHVRSLASI